MSLPGERTWTRSCEGDPPKKTESPCSARASQAAHIMVAFEAQRVEAVVCQAHDLPVSLVVTEERILRL